MSELNIDMLKLGKLCYYCPSCGNIQKIYNICRKCETKMQIDYECYEGEADNE